MHIAFNYGYWEFWAPQEPTLGFYGSQKCVFDGENKLIYVNPNESEISVKEDVYSGWKEWTSVRDNSRFLPAIRTTGGDPIAGTNISTGDVYFLINGWRFLIDHSLNIDGVIYSDNFSSPFIQQEGTQIVTNKVSSLVQTVATESIGGITVPTAVEIRQEMDTNSSKLISINNKVQTLTNTGLTTTQATMLLEMYNLLGLDPTKPLIVTQNARVAGDISQMIVTSSNETIVSRV